MNREQGNINMINEIKAASSITEAINEFTPLSHDVIIENTLEIIATVLIDISSSFAIIADDINLISKAIDNIKEGDNNECL